MNTALDSGTITNEIRKKAEDAALAAMDTPEFSRHKHELQDKFDVITSEKNGGGTDYKQVAAFITKKLGEIPLPHLLEEKNAVKAGLKAYLETLQKELGIDPNIIPPETLKDARNAVMALANPVTGSSKIMPQPLTFTAGHEPFARRPSSIAQHHDAVLGALRVVEETSGGKLDATRATVQSMLEEKTTPYVPPNPIAYASNPEATAVKMALSTYLNAIETAMNPEVAAARRV